MSQNQEGVETFAIVPISKWRTMEKRLKNFEEDKAEPVPDPPQTTPPNVPAVEEPKKKELKQKYQKVQIKKLLQHVERLDDSQHITSLENIEQLIDTALGSSKKLVPNEEMFFTYLFDNNLAHFVKNRSKIARYYKDRDNWFQI